VTTGIGGLAMTKRTRDLAKRGTGGVTGGSGQVTRLAGMVAPARSGSLAHRVVPAHLACRIGARAQAGERPRPLDHSPCRAGPARPSARRQQAPPIRAARRAGKRRHRRQARPVEQETPHNDHADVAVRDHTGAVTTGRNCHAERGCDDRVRAA
jgi:hypothetical protein